MAFAQQLLTFKNNIGPYVTRFGLTADEVSGQAADADRFYWEVMVWQICQQCAEQWTAWRKITRAGGMAATTGAPAPVTMPTPEPAAVVPGVEKRFRDLCNKIKPLAAYNVGIGKILGIEGDVIAPPNFAILAPELKLKLTAAGVLVGWGWQGFSLFLGSCEIHVDRGDGQGFRLLTIDTTPNYTDTEAIPATPTKWRYRAVYRVGDARVGQWSNPVSIAVG